MTESRIQTAIVNYLRTQGYLVAAIPNGGARDKRTGATMKREGALAGHPDLNIYIDNTVVFVEVKTPTGRLSEKQKQFRADAKGYTYMIWRSIDDAIEWHEYRKTLENYTEL